MNVRLIGEVLLSGVLPFLSLLLIADMKFDLSTRLFRGDQQNLKELATPITLIGIALAYLIGSVTYVICRVITLKRLEMKWWSRWLAWFVRKVLRGGTSEYNARQEGEALFYVLQHATPALAERITLGAPLVYVHKSLLVGVPIFGLALGYWLADRDLVNCVEFWVVIIVTIAIFALLARLSLPFTIHP